MALRWSLVLMLCLTAGGVQAQKRTFKEKLIHFLDSSNVDRTDPAYITLPKRPWRVIASSSTDQMDLKLTSHQDYYFWEESSETNYHNVYDYRIVIKPPVATSVGLWAGYRGWGAGYSLSLTGNKGINLSFNISTPSNGVNIRIHRFDFDKPKTELYNLYTDGIQGEDWSFNETLLTPMKVESFVFDGYWVFNRKRFSLAAAYDQSVIQLRSAGSFLAGAMFYYQKMDFSQKENYADFCGLFRGLGRVKIYQGSLGVGYTYNWVPLRGLVVNAVIMPVVSLVNHTDAGYYTIKNDLDEEEEFDWDRLWMERTMTDSQNGSVRLNLDTRMSVSYWIDRWFISVMGQGKQFNSDYKNTTVKLTDWNINASVGLTF